MPTTQSSDATVKRATTMDASAAEEEEAASSLPENPRIKKENDENEDMEYEYEPEFDADGNEIIPGRVPNLVEPKPEWDVDSYDDCEYELDPEIRGRLNDDAYLKFRNSRIETLKHRGFKPDLVKSIYPIMYLDAPEGPNKMTNREYLTNLANLCIQKFNDENGKTVEFVSVVRGNMTSGSWWKVYITFMAREYQDGPLVEYQAKAMDYVGGGSRPPFPILCRPAPVNPNLCS